MMGFRDSKCPGSGGLRKGTSRALPGHELVIPFAACGAFKVDTEAPNEKLDDGDHNIIVQSAELVWVRLFDLFQSLSASDPV